MACARLGNTEMTRPPIADLLQRRRQVLDSSLESRIVGFAHDDVNVSGVVLDQRLAQRSLIRHWRLIRLTRLYWEKHQCLPRRELSTFAL